MKHIDRPLLKNTMRKLLNLPKIEPLRHGWESLTLTTAPISFTNLLLNVGYTENIVVVNNHILTRLLPLNSARVTIRMQYENHKAPKKIRARNCRPESTNKHRSILTTPKKAPQRANVFNPLLLLSLLFLPLPSKEAPSNMVTSSSGSSWSMFGRYQWIRNLYVWLSFVIPFVYILKKKKLVSRKLPTNNILRYSSCVSTWVDFGLCYLRQAM